MEHPAALATVPEFLLALLVVRGAPALAFRRDLPRGEVLAVGLLQATSLPFLLAAVEIGREMWLLDPAVGARLVAAGLVSVLVFPAVALTMLPREPSRRRCDGRYSPWVTAEDPGMLAALCAGDAVAFAAVVRKWSPAMLRVARAYVRSHSSTEEVVQQAWLGCCARCRASRAAPICAPGCSASSSTSPNAVDGSRNA